MQKALILLVGPGYLGRELAFSLAEAGREVVVASRSGTEVPGCLARACDLGSTESVNGLATALGAGGSGNPPAAVVHCASSGRGGGTEAYRSVYRDGAERLARAFPESPLLFCSSTSVYPQTGGEAVTEESPATPSAESARTLREAEEIVLASGGGVLRIAGIYGPGRSAHLRRVLAGGARVETGEPSRWLNQIHRDDLVAAARHLLLGPSERWRGEIFNVSDDQPLRMRECYQWLAETFGKELGPDQPRGEIARKRPWTSKRVDNAKLRATGWQPKYPSFYDAVERGLAMPNDECPMTKE